MSEERRLYDHIRCPVCGIPFFSSDSLRWPLHPMSTTCHQYAPKHPASMTEAEVRVNLNQKKPWSALIELMRRNPQPYRGSNQ
jgi:hypothetical protein